MSTTDTIQPFDPISECYEPRCVNFYRCWICAHEWQNESSWQRDDNCPECGCRHIFPYKSEDIK
jgi:DNA-directed RNA polymerase subunit RPC12/RpoP